ncbi:MAG: hypothetical protein R2770_03415 [Acidimicrobiales bacterium]
MGFTGPSNDAAAPGFDLCLADDGIRDAYDRAVEGRWQHLDEFFASRSDAWLVQQVLADEASQIQVTTFADWAEAAPSTLSVTMMGLLQVRDAWKVRGDVDDANIDPAVQEQFVTRLELAESSLMVATNFDRSSPVAWAARVITARDLGMGLKELHTRFDKAHALDPFRPDACSDMLQALTAKWGGNHELMFDFARWIERDAPADSPARAALPMAHLERAIAPSSGVGSPDDDVRPSTYFSRPEVNAEVATAASSFLDAVGGSVEPRHLFALNAYLVALFPLAPATTELVERLIGAIADRPTPLPWRYYRNDVVSGYQTVCAERREIASRFGQGT